MTNFSDLRDARHRLRRFCVKHVESVEYFRSGISFRLHTDEGAIEGPLTHLTSTATCLESLGESTEPPRDLEARRLTFIRAALARKHKKWTSEESAPIYCRCRGLPLVLSHLSSFKSSLDEHVNLLLQQLNHPDRFAIGEADPKEPGEPVYPSNAYHTYWTLRILDLIANFRKSGVTPTKNSATERRRQVMRLWVRKSLTEQIALHRSKASSLDTEQLIWSLSGFVQYGDFRSYSLADQVLVREAVDAIFSTQTDEGVWPLFSPLFHYRFSGNAYCYTFESLFVLLRLALEKYPSLLANRLKEHVGSLLLLYEYAERNAMPLGDSGGIGWNSGHRPGHSSPESWATASVFSFCEVLRRLIGLWVRDSALLALHAQPATGDRDKALATLRERGDTWSQTSVASELITLFVNPTLMQTGNSSDRDLPAISEEHSRSAILFGPPGTSKTTLTQSVADAIGWDFVEIHASHFVAEGLPNVQRKADEIFHYIDELDRAVVLFDEIDELVRDREGKADSFGRFLTTSMLPRLAELWKRRNVLYFVATNHIEWFDAAIIRSQRFDALIFVPPPSFRKKVARLRSLLYEYSGNQSQILLTEEDCTSALASIKERSKDFGKTKSLSSADREQNKVYPLEEGEALAKFVLLRWDQLDELAHHLLSCYGPEVRRFELEHLRTALSLNRDRNLDSTKPYMDFDRDTNFPRRDYRKRRVWRLEGRGFPNDDHVIANDEGTWAWAYSDDYAKLSLGVKLFENQPGILRRLRQ